MEDGVKKEMEDFEAGTREGEEHKSIYNPNSHFQLPNSLLKVETKREQDGWIGFEEW